MKSRAQKFWQFLSGKGFLWLILLSCSAIFLFPFLWMILSSVKTDEEVNKGEFWPSMPEFQPHSPYIITAEKPTKPDDLTDEQWSSLLKKFSQHAKQIVAQDELRPRLLPDADENQKLIDEVTQFLVKRGMEKMSQQVWAEKEDAIMAAFITALNAGGGVRVELDKAYNKIHARLVLHSVKVRSRGVGTVFEQKFSNKQPSSSLPDGMSLTNATHGGLEYDADGKLVLRSYFGSSSDEPVVLQHKFTVQRPADEIFRVIIPMDLDGSWHQIHVQLEIDGATYEGTRATWLAQNQPSALTLQVSGNDEEEWGKRPWIPMKKTSGSFTPNKKTSDCTLTLTLDPSSTTGARYGKVKRNYERVFLSMPFWKYVINSILVTVLSIFGAVLSSSFIAYAFARLRWPGRSLAFLILLSTMMLPPQVTMIPQFLIWRELGWYNTLNPIWVPTWFGVAFFIFLMVQQMKTIPRDLEEAAQIDGMNRLQIWWYVIVPLVKPAMAAIAIMSFMASWNEFMQPLIYLRDMGRFPLSVGIYAMGADDTTSHDMSLILAGNLLMTLPVIVIFFFFQRYFIQGMSSSGVKG
ncbi:MAG: ABC transporter permease subunit [Akkermansiaceae bacterium]